MSTQSTKKKDETLLVNPVNSQNTGNVFPIFLAIVIGSLAWIFIDPELRRGLSSFTGIGYVPDVIEDLISKEFTIKLHGSYSSTCSQRVLLVANEKDLDVDMHIVDAMKKENKDPEYIRTMHPFGQIPVLELEDEGQYIFESRAIAAYLERRYPDRGTSFAVNGGALEKTYYDQALSIEAFDFDPPASQLYKEVVLKPRTGGVPNPETIATIKSLWTSKLDAYEAILSTRPYLAGQNLTMADLFHLPYGQKIIDAGHGEPLMDSKTRPYLADWWKALSERPSWQAVLKANEDWQEAQRKEKEEQLKKEEEEAAKEH